MVAPTSTAPGSSATVPLLPSALSGRGGLVRFTVDDVLVMLRDGVLPEDATTELLNGLVVQKDRSDLGEDSRVHGTKHRMCVALLTTLAAAIEGADRHVQIQLPLVCGEDQMPEPDFAVIRGLPRNYAEKLPTAADALCVVEVADSSLQRDLEEKLPIYASAGVPQYIVINLRNRTADVYDSPDPANGTFGSSVRIMDVGNLSLRLMDVKPFDVPLAHLLP